MAEEFGKYTNVLGRTIATYLSINYINRTAGISSVKTF